MGYIYARLPEELERQVIDKSLDKYNRMEPHEQVMLEASYDEYRKKVGVGEAMLSWPVWIICMYESYINLD